MCWTCDGSFPGINAETGNFQCGASRRLTSLRKSFFISGVTNPILICETGEERASFVSYSNYVAPPTLPSAVLHFSHWQSQPSTSMGLPRCRCDGLHVICVKLCFPSYVLVCMLSERIVWHVRALLVETNIYPTILWIGSDAICLFPLICFQQDSFQLTNVSMMSGIPPFSSVQSHPRILPVCILYTGCRTTSLRSSACLYVSVWFVLTNVCFFFEQGHSRRFQVWGPCWYLYFSTHTLSPQKCFPFSSFPDCYASHWICTQLSLLLKEVYLWVWLSVYSFWTSRTNADVILYGYGVTLNRRCRGNGKSVKKWFDTFCCKRCLPATTHQDQSYLAHLQPNCRIHGILSFLSTTPTSATTRTDKTRNTSLTSNGFCINFAW